jgi:hypothetical protein
MGILRMSPRVPIQAPPFATAAQGLAERPEGRRLFDMLRAAIR